MMLDMQRKAPLDDPGGWIFGTMRLYARNSVLATILFVLLSFLYAAVTSILSLRIGPGADQSSIIIGAALFMTLPLAFETFAARQKRADDRGDSSHSAVLGPTPLVGAKFRIPAMDGLYGSIVKRVLDIVLAGFLLLLMMPLFCVIVTMIRADGNPAFFAHFRIGRGGQHFGCLQFRTMRPDAERVLLEILSANPMMAQEWAATQKLRRDPRITYVGRLLRDTSLYVLPQLINVLRGEMSFVGPRPLTRKEHDNYNRYGAAAIASYYSVRPGITGLWQVSGHSDTDFAQRVALDMAYVKVQSLTTDLRILLRTIGKTLI